MRFSPLVKKVFDDDLFEVDIITPTEFKRKIKTKKILIDVKVISKLFEFFANKGKKEGVALLIGHMEGSFLLVVDAYCCVNAESDPTNVKIPPESFTEAGNIIDGNYICGWCHSHPFMSIFMSGNDRGTQFDFQSMFPDAIAMVMNPFANNGIDFSFFRFNEDNVLEKISYNYMVKGNEN
jgi:proteasome lid subunit RPN8/RPN11